MPKSSDDQTFTQVSGVPAPVLRTANDL